MKLSKGQLYPRLPQPAGIKLNKGQFYTSVWGEVDAAINVLVVAPTANVTAAATVPDVAVTATTTIEPPIALADVAGIVPSITALTVINATVIPPPANTDVAGQVPDISTTEQVTLEPPIAEAAAAGEIPDISTTATVTVDTPIAEATAAGVVPSVDTEGTASVAAPIAGATATGQLPSIEAIKNVTIDAPIAVINAAAVVPTVTAVKTVEIIAPTAEATAEAEPPDIATGVSARIDALIAQANAASIVPDISTTTGTTITAPIAEATAEARRADAVILPRGDMVLWLDAVTLLPSPSSSKVTIWYDSSGEGNDVWAEFLYRPTFRHNILNGLPVVRFVEGEVLRRGDGSVVLENIITTQPTSTFVVWSLSAGSTTSPATVFDSSGTSPAQYLQHIDGPGRLTAGSFVDVENQGQIEYSIDKPIAHQINAIVYDGTESKLYQDTVLRAEGDVSTGGMAGITLGGAYTGAGNFAGDIAEVIIYDRDLSDEEREQVTEYLRRKWFGWRPGMVFAYPAPAQASADGVAPVISTTRAVDITAPIAEATAEGIAPTVTTTSATDTTVTPPEGEAEAEGTPPTVWTGRAIVVPPAEATAAGHGVSFARPYVPIAVYERCIYLDSVERCIEVNAYARCIYLDSVERCIEVNTQARCIILGVIRC